MSQNKPTPPSNLDQLTMKADYGPWFSREYALETKFFPKDGSPPVLLRDVDLSSLLNRNLGTQDLSARKPGGQHG